MKRKKSNKDNQTKHTVRNDVEPIVERKVKNRELVWVSYFFVGIFLSLIAYLTYFNIVQIGRINSNPNNTKRDAKSEQIIRGAIYSADGEILAGTNVDEEGNERRHYPFERVFSHIIGYVSNGKSGVEATSNYELMDSHASLLQQLRQEAWESINS